MHAYMCEKFCGKCNSKTNAQNSMKLNIQCIRHKTTHFFYQFSFDHMQRSRYPPHTHTRTHTHTYSSRSAIFQCPFFSYSKHCSYSRVKFAQYLLSLDVLSNHLDIFHLSGSDFDKQKCMKCLSQKILNVQFMHQNKF